MFRLARALLACGLLVLLFWFLDVEAAVAHLKNADWRWLVVAFLVVQLQIVLSAFRWKITANRLGQPLSGGRAISEYYLSTFVNLTLPGGVVGDAARVFRNRLPHALVTSVQGVVLERLSGQLALLLTALSGWLLWFVFMRESMPAIATRLILLVCFAVFLVVLFACLLYKFATGELRQKLLNTGKAAQLVWLADYQWLIQGALSLCIVATYLLVFMCSAYAINVPLPLSLVITLVPLVLLSMLIPLSVGGWGIREATAAILWPIAALAPEAGVVTSIVYALISWLGCVPGLLVLLFSRSGSSHS